MHTPTPKTREGGPASPTAMPCGPCSFPAARAEPRCERHFSLDIPPPHGADTSDSNIFAPSSTQRKQYDGGAGAEPEPRRGRPDAGAVSTYPPAKRWDSVETDTTEGGAVSSGAGDSAGGESEFLCEGFHRGRMGQDLRLAGGDVCCVERVGGIGGSRMVLSAEGLTSGMAEWELRIDRAGLGAASVEQGSLRTFKCSHTLRQAMTRACGIRIGVGNAGANLRWFVGFDAKSMGLHNKGGVWHDGTPFQEQSMDRDRRTASFGAGDRVTVTADLDRDTLKFSINDNPVPGVHYLRRLVPGEPVFLAISLLWPGEMVTMVREDIYESA